MKTTFLTPLLAASLLLAGAANAQTTGTGSTGTGSTGTSGTGSTNNQGTNMPGTTGTGVGNTTGQPTQEQYNAGQYKRDSSAAGSNTSTTPSVDDPRAGAVPNSNATQGAGTAAAATNAGAGMNEAYSNPATMRKFSSPVMVAGKPVTVKLRNDSQEEFHFAAGDVMGSIPAGQNAELTVPAGTQLKFGEGENALFYTLKSKHDGKWVDVNSIKSAGRGSKGEKSRKKAMDKMTQPEGSR